MYSIHSIRESIDRLFSRYFLAIIRKKIKKDHNSIADRFSELKSPNEFYEANKQSTCSDRGEKSELSEAINEIIKDWPDLVFAKVLFLSYGDEHLAISLHKHFKFLVTIPLEPYITKKTIESNSSARHAMLSSRCLVSTPLADPRADLENCDVIIAFRSIHCLSNLLPAQLPAIILKRLSNHADAVITADVKNIKCFDNEASGASVRLIKNDKISNALFNRKAERVVYKEAAAPTTKRKFYFSEDRFIKVYQTKNGMSPVFEKELTALIAIQDYDFVPKIYDWGYSGHQAFIEMQRISGEGLIDALKKKNQDQAFDRNFYITEYLRFSLLIIERIGWHNDLQARNMIITPDGKIFVLDFESISQVPKNSPFTLFMRFVVRVLGGKPSRDAKEKNHSSVLKRITKLKGCMPVTADSEITDLINSIHPDLDWIEFANKCMLTLSPKKQMAVK